MNHFYSTTSLNVTEYDTGLIFTLLLHSIPHLLRIVHISHSHLSSSYKSFVQVTFYGQESDSRAQQAE